MNKQYAIIISRYNEDDSQDVLVDRYISADQAIDLMVLVQGLDEVITGEPVPEPEPEIEGYNAPIKGSMGTLPKDLVKIKSKSKPKRTGKYSDYDVEAVREDILKGLKPQEIADKHGTTIGAIYQRKAELKKNGELGGKPKVAKAEETTHNPEAEKARLFSKLNAEEKELIRMYNEDGLTKAELFNLFPSLETIRIADLIEAYGNK